jgi:hypothetical protein
MSSPVSSRCVIVPGDDALEGLVAGRGAGGVALPAVPDDIQPGAGENAHGVGVVFAADDGVVVELGGPGAGASGVAGEVPDGVAQLLVGRLAVADQLGLASQTSGGGDAGRTDQRLGGGVASAAAADHDHGHPGAQQGLHDRPVTALDRGLGRPGLARPADQVRQPGRGVLDGEPGRHLPGGVHDAHRVVGAGPVDPGSHASWRRCRQGHASILHDSLLAATSVGRHPHARCRDAAASPLTVRHSVALSPAGGQHVPGNRRAPQNSRRTSVCRASRAVTRRHLGCISSLTAADTRKVRQ